MSIKIISVDEGSPAQRGGFVPGDEIMSCNGHDLNDVLDYKYHTYDARLKIKIQRANGKCKNIRVRKGDGEELGLNFEDYLGDKSKHCVNHCIFCFIDQMPPNMRDTLYFKDDDVRLSFLQGNYISLTNLSEKDLQRIAELRISPINVSVQTTNPELRVKMLGNPRAGKCLEYMRRMADAHINMNCQIVACPGYNDGEELSRSLSDLGELYPAINSISIVPVGLTKYRKGLCQLNPVGQEEARSILDIANGFGDRFFKKYGTRLIFCADELYLKAGRPVPGAEYYEEFPQIENGVGLMASFEDEVRGALEEGVFSAPAPFTIVTGVAAESFMCRMVELFKKSCNNISCNVIVVKNNFFGESITVAGLITGQDIAATLAGKQLGARVLIPSVMLRRGDNVFLDDMTVDELSEKLGVPVDPVECTGDAFVRAVFGK